jgi:hypothetical protein
MQHDGLVDCLEISSAADADRTERHAARPPSSSPRRP